MTTLIPGQNVGAYQIIEQVGKGGMATVYKAYHAAMDRYVAIKILPFQFAQNKEFNERFKREIRTIAKLEHPRILPVYDSGEHEGTPYLVMRYLDAGTLKDRIEEGGLTLEETNHIFTQLADALSYAHSQEIIHRDIKPSNVLLTERGDIFLTDFGIAKLIGEHTQFTVSGAITGTPAYMSPEQGEGRAIDARSDIYALGVVLYEMVTGRVPFEAETPLAVILKHLQAPLPPPSQLNPHLHSALERVILKALAKNREDRFATVTEMLAAWKAAMDEAGSDSSVAAPPAPAGQVAPIPILSPPLTEAEPSPAGTAAAASAPRRPWMVVSLILVGVVCLCLGGFAVFRACCAGSLRPGAGAGTPLTPGAALTPEGSLPSAGELPFPARGGEWESWAGSGVVFTLALSKTHVLAGGLGGISIYNSNGDLVNQLTVQDGLPDNRVYYLFHDQEGDGSWWVGTASGLGRYDGENWVVYGFEDGLDDTNINFVNRVGNLIVAGTSYGPEGGGLNFFDGQSWWQPPEFDSSFEPGPGQFSNKVWSAVADPQTGYLWFSTEHGVGLYDWAGNWTRFGTEHGLPDQFVTGLFFDHDQILIAATESGAAWFDGASFVPFEPTLGTAINGFTQDSVGDYWFGGSGGIWRYSSGLGDWEFFEGGVDLPFYTAYRATADAGGRVFFGTDGVGVAVYDEQAFHTLALPSGPTQAATGGILQAPNGVLWFFEEYGVTIDTYDPRQDAWAPEVFEVCCVVPMAFDQQGNVWGGGDTGLWIVSQEGEAFNLTTEHGLPSNQVFDLAFSLEGTVWLATDLGLAELDETGVVRTLGGAEMGLTSDWTQLVYAASDGSLWVGREGGLSRVSAAGEWQHFEVGAPFSDSFSEVTAVIEHPDGSIWVATSGDGLFQYQSGAWKQYLPTDAGVQLPSFYVNGITVAPDGSLWFGTDNGVARFNGGEWWAWGVSDGLGHWNVNAVYVEADGTTWFATSGGITRWRP